MANKTVTLVGAERFSSPQITSETGRATPVLRNEAVAVSSALAAHLLTLSYRDSRNNELPVFAEGDLSKKKAPAAKKPVRRRRAAA